MDRSPNSSMVMTCPACQQPVFRTEAGFRAHLRGHRNRREITPERSEEILDRVFPRRIKRAR